MSEAAARPTAALLESPPTLLLGGSFEMHGADLHLAVQCAGVGASRLLAAAHVDGLLLLWKWCYGEELLSNRRVAHACHDPGGHLLVDACRTQLRWTCQAFESHIKSNAGEMPPITHY